MRSPALFFAVLILAACGRAPAIRNESRQSTDSVVQFLLTASVNDFRAHGPHPEGFRDVRVGHFLSPNGKEQYTYILCGQVLPAQEAGKAEWAPFATIKTSGYEQWIGAQATSLCQRSSIIWDKGGDLSSSLQSRLDSLR